MLVLFECAAGYAVFKVSNVVMENDNTLLLQAEWSVLRHVLQSWYSLWAYRTVRRQTNSRSVKSRTG